MAADRQLRIGLIINPVAGVGGPAGLKGSDGQEVVARARAAGSESRVIDRVQQALTGLEKFQDKFRFITAPGVMGEAAIAFGEPIVIGELSDDSTTAADTRRLARQLMESNLDLLVFAGGDGTARDILDAVGAEQVVLGIPCGVKMHSGVFANHPQAAGEIIAAIVMGKLTTVAAAEVRDIDEEAFRDNIVRARFYGEMRVPQELQYLQATKIGGKESEELVVTEIAADIVDNLEADVSYLIGSGSTTAAIMAQLGLPNTLLGVDIVRDQQVIIGDANEGQLFEHVNNNPSRIVVTAIGGQGHVFGRGNQQLSARVIRAVGLDNIVIVATKSKLEHLQRLLVDTGDPSLDESLRGLVEVVTGYEDRVLCRIE